MTLLDDVRLGAQRPRWQKLPPSVASSAGPEAVDLAASAGIILDDWQEWWLGHALSERPDGNWSAKENVLITGRQAGKNGVLGALELFYLFLLGDPLVIHSAHELPTAINHFNFMLAVIDGCPDLSKKCKRPTFTNGEQAINLRSGAMLKFRARGKNSGRGLTASRLVFDEAFKIAAESMGALMPTLRAMRNTQITYASSAPKHDSNVLHGLINRGRADDPDDRLFYAEWGNPIGTAMDDVDAWYQANPSLGVIRSNGTGVEEQSLHDEYRSLVSGGDEDLIAEFAREAAGIGELPLTVDAKPIKIPADKWASDLTEADILERWPKATSLAFDVTRDGEWSSISVGAGTITDPFVQTVVHNKGVGWLPAALVDWVAKINPPAVGYNSAGPVAAQIAAVLEAFIAAGLSADLLRPFNGGEYKAACGGFYTDVVEGRLSHPADGQAPLDAAALDATERPLVDAFAWAQRSEPISPLTSATLARALLPAEPTAPAPFFMVVGGSS